MGNRQEILKACRIISKITKVRAGRLIELISKEMD